MIGNRERTPDALKPFANGLLCRRLTGSRQGSSRLSRLAILWLENPAIDPERFNELVVEHGLEQGFSILDLLSDSDGECWLRPTDRPR